MTDKSLHIINYRPNKAHLSITIHLAQMDLFDNTAGHRGSRMLFWNEAGNLYTVADDAQFSYYVYDAMGQPLSSTDPEGFTTSYTYDLLGRPTSRSHPDAGMTSTAYDAAGNVTSVTNAAGETVTTAYHYGRPTNVHYPRLPQNDIAYQYDNAGRLSEVTDGSGRTRLYYDVMGNVCRSERTLAVPSLAETYTFATDFAFDSWGRIQLMTYPDGETVSYSYDHGGNLHAMAGVKGGQTRSIVNRILYDSCGNRSLMEYSNGVTTRYTHDSLQRLAHLTTSVPGSSPTALQDIGYTFNAVGGITAIKNTASPLSASPVGGSYTNLFRYDDLDRLVLASQSYGAGNSLEASYSPSGRLCRNKQTFTGHDITYGYMNEVRPHAPLLAADEMSRSLHRLRWDACGNLAQVDGFSVSTYGATAEGSRHLFWTEDSRLVDVADGKWLSHYVYDYSGERAVKLTGPNSVSDINANVVSCEAVLKSVTLYPSPYLVATETGYTKHYWAGAERVCSAVGGGGLGANLGGGMPFIGHEPALSAKAGALVEACRQSMAERRLPPEHGGVISSPCGIIHPYFALQLRDVATAVNATIHIAASRFSQTMQHLASPGQNTEPLYYFHGDHLGSASWITDKNGIPVQHLQYLPFGEPFVNQRASGSTYDERFTFTAKERDTETGFSYFGARYYDPDLSALWLSVDPMADKYPGISPYAYCAWNPVKLVDPDGRDTINLAESRFLRTQPDVCNSLIINAHGASRPPFIINNNIDYHDDLPMMTPLSASSMAECIWSSTVYQENQNNNHVTPVFLISCHTGENSVPYYSFAYELNQLLPNALIIAPIGDVHTKNGSMWLSPNQGENYDCYWRIMYNGQDIGQINNQEAFNIPTLLSSMQQKVDRYNASNPNNQIQLPKLNLQ